MSKTAFPSHCYRNGSCGPYEMMSCSECPASKPDYKQKHTISIPVVTNYDLLISKTPEELAAWIADQPIVSDFDPNNSWHMAWFNWLKAPADKEEE